MNTIDQTPKSAQQNHVTRRGRLLRTAAIGSGIFLAGYLGANIINDDTTPEITEHSVEYTCTPDGGTVIVNQGDNAWDLTHGLTPENLKFGVTAIAIANNLDPSSIARDLQPGMELRTITCTEIPPTKLS